MLLNRQERIIRELKKLGLKEYKVREAMRNIGDPSDTHWPVDAAEQTVRELTKLVVIIGELTKMEATRNIGDPSDTHWPVDAAEQTVRELTKLVVIIGELTKMEAIRNIGDPSDR